MSQFIPKAGENLTVTLPGELMRAIVTKVVDRHTVFVEIGQPMTRSHNYRLGDLVACRRKQGVLGEIWLALDDRVVFARPVDPEPAAHPTGKRAKKPAGRAKVKVPPRRTKREA